MNSIESLVESKVFREALAPPTESEVAGLESLIESSRQCLMPILYHMDELGTPIVVDGYTRLDIYRRRPDIFDDPPKMTEVIELSGESEEVVVDWIRRHQAFRRNNEKLIQAYQIGKQAEAKGAAAVADEQNMSSSKVRHAKALSDAVDACDELEEGLKDEILESDIPAQVVKEAAATGDTTRLKETLQNGPTRSRPQGMSGRFQKVHKLIGQLSRAVGDIENETTPNKWSEELKDNINHISDVVQEWENAELLGE